MFYEKCVLKNFAIFAGKHLCQILFLSCNFIKNETLAQGFSCEFCKIFKSFFTEHLWILQQLLALNFAIIYSWQLSSSEKSLVRKTIQPYISRILEITRIYTIFFFIYSNANFEHFPRNARFLSFDGSTDYLYLLKNHRQSFS